MKARWSIIPDIGDIDRCLSLAQEYDTAFEYNDFFWPYVYEDKDETEKRIRLYEKLERDKSRDTLHGVFYDIAMISTDSVIRKRSRELVEQSMDIACRLNCKGVVFHTGRLAGLDTDEYNRIWLDGMSGYMSELSDRYKDIHIYIENTFEKSPDPIVDLVKNLKGHDNVYVCLDYAHACLTETEPAKWYDAFSPYIGHMHINDHDMRSDLHLAAGDGKIDYNEFKELVDKYGTDVNMLIEVNGYERIKRSLRFLREL